MKKETMWNDGEGMRDGENHSSNTDIAMLWQNCQEHNCISGTGGCISIYTKSYVLPIVFMGF